MLETAYLPHFAALVVFGAFAHGFMGLGFGIIVIAGLAFTGLDIERASVVLSLLLPLLFTTVIYATGREFRLHVKWKLATVLFLGSFLGVPLGYWFLYTQGASPVFHLVLGLALIMFSLDYLIKPRIHTRLPLYTGLAAGLAGGFLAGAFTAGGPPIALFMYTHFEQPSEAKGTLQMVFLSATWWRLMNVWLFSPGFSMQILTWAGLLAPVMVLCALLGHRTAGKLSPKSFSRVVYCFIGLAGIANVIRYFA